VDVRIVAASNRDLTGAIQQGRFREDFYYRLNVFSLTIEPLKNRRDDIPGLVDHFVRKFSLEMEKEISGIDDDVMMFFLQYDWPGNVRELENIIERAVVLCEAPVITRNEMPQDVLFDRGDAAGPIPMSQDHDLESRSSDSLSLIERTDQMEAEIIKSALDRFHWNKSKTADHLGIKRTTLQYKIKKYGLE
jgi:transcriptional regulator with PAS, ATPase and Fis domain